MDKVSRIIEKYKRIVIEQAHSIIMLEVELEARDKEIEELKAKLADKNA